MTVTNVTCKKCTHGNKVTVEFSDGTFTFHSQWLHDACCDDGAARNARTALCQQPTQSVYVESALMNGQGVAGTLEITWDDGLSSKLPIPWLRVMASLVAAEVKKPQLVSEQIEKKGWTVGTLAIPEISYNDLFPKEFNQQQLDATILSTLDKILSSSSPGMIKIIDLPEPIIEDKHNHINNLNTFVLKRLFGSIFIHPIRGFDQAFNVSSHSHDSTRKVGLPNYDTTQILLPHTDHAFYNNRIQVQGFYGLEGTSMNTWTSSLAALDTLKEETPESYHHLCQARMAVGRVSRFYGDPLYQATADTVVTLQPGTDQVKHYKEARIAHQKFQEIIRRDTHQLKIMLKPGDLYIWDNFRLLHGREKVLEVPRTGVGQTVPEQTVHDRYRALIIKKLKGLMDKEWLVHMPMPQLREMLQAVEDRQARNDGTAADELNLK